MYLGTCFKLPAYKKISNGGVKSTFFFPHSSKVCRFLLWMHTPKGQVHTRAGTVATPDRAYWNIFLLIFLRLVSSWFVSWNHSQGLLPSTILQRNLWLYRATPCAWWPISSPPSWLAPFHLSLAATIETKAPNFQILADNAHSGTKDDMYWEPESYFFVVVVCG